MRLREIIITLRWCISVAPDRRAAVAIGALSLVNMVLFVAPALIVADMVNDAVAHSGLRPIAIDLVAFALVGLASAASTSQLSFEVGRASELLSARLRDLTLERVLSFPLSFYTHAPVGAIVSRVTKSTQEAAYGAYAAISSGIDQLLRITAAVAVVAYLDWRLAIVAAVVIPIVFWPGRREVPRMADASDAVIDAMTELHSMVTERVGFDAVLLARQMDRVRDDFAVLEAQSRRQLEVSLARSRVQSTFTFTVGAAAQVAQVAVLAVCVVLVETGGASVGVVAGFAVLLAQLYGPLSVLSSTFGTVQSGMAATRRLTTLLDDDDVWDAPAVGGEEPSPFEASGGELVAKAITYRYPPRAAVARALCIDDPAGPDVRSEPALRDVSFVIPAGSFTLIVGRSGAGKTTLAQLLAGLAAPDSGEVLIGGVAARDVLIRHHRARRLILVSQSPFLLRATLRANIAFGRPDAPDEEILGVCAAAQLGSLLERLPGGLDTVVGERGFAVSGGERQRIAVARALLVEPEILIMDEPTAHLDESAAVSLLAEVRRLRPGKTLIVVAHRLAQYADADLIIALERGRLSEIGAPADLPSLASSLVADARTGAP